VHITEQQQVNRMPDLHKLGFDHKDANKHKHELEFTEIITVLHIIA